VERDVRNHLAYLIDLGEEDLYRERLGESPPAEAAAEAPGVETPRRALEPLRTAAEGCRRCALADTRTKVVFGVGDPGAELMFVGEAPGREEDRRGEPFVGAAGELLDRILAAMALTRDEVYIANVLKCRPPENRDPLPGEIEACRSYLEGQVEAIRPRVICTLGSFAARTLLGLNSPLGRLRGRVHVFRGIDVVPTYHPAALLRHPAWKRPTWEDMKVVLRLLGRTPAHP